MNARHLKKQLNYYYGFQVFIALLFWVPIFYAYQKSRGLNDTEYFHIQSLYYWFFCFLEIPTGFLSDRWGHRKTLILSSLIMLITNIFAVFSFSYFEFLIHFILIAVARSLMSGAASAYLYNLLSLNNLEKTYKQIEGKARSFSLITRVLAWSVSGYLFTWNMASPYWLTALASLLALTCAFQFHENKKTEDSHSSNTLYSPQGIKKQILQNKKLLLTMFLGASIFVLVRLTQVNLYQPLLELKKFSVSSFGTIMGFMTIFEALGSHQAYRLQKWFSDTKSIFLSSALVSVSLLLLTISSKIYIPILFALFSLFSGIAFPLIRQLMNEVIIDGKWRASIISIESMVHRAFTGIAALSAAYFVASKSILPFLQGLAIVTFLFVGLVLLGLKRVD